MLPIFKLCANASISLFSNPAQVNPVLQNLPKQYGV